MRTKFVFTLICLFSKCAIAQFVYFNNVYFSSQTDLRGQLQNTFLNEDKYTVVGRSLYDKNFIREYDLNGVLVDSTSSELGFPAYLGGIGSVYQSALQLSDDSYIVMSSPFDTSCIYWSSGIGFSRINIEEVLWSNTYFEFNLDCSFHIMIYPEAMCSLTDSTFLVTSWMNTLAPLPEYANGYQFTIFNVDGEVLENHQHWLPDQFADYRTNLTLYNNTILAVGETRADANSAEEVLFGKYDLQGNLVDSIHFGHPDFIEFPSTGILRPDGNFLLCYDQLTYQNILNNQYKVQPHQVLINPETMSVIWHHTSQDFIAEDLFLMGSQYSQAIVTSDEKMLVVGACSEGVGNSVFLPSPNHTYVYKYDYDGVLEWQNEYYNQVFESNSGGFLTILESPDGGYLLSGTPDSLQLIWLLKIDACGYEVPLDCPLVNGVSEVPEENIGITLWPNPIVQSLNAIIPQNSIRVFITDMTGRTVYEERVYYPNQQFDLSKLRKGVYVFNVELDDGNVVSQRIVKS